MKLPRLTPVKLLLLVGVIGAIVHFWPSHNAVSPSEQSAMAVHEKKPTAKKKAVAMLESNPSFGMTPPPAPGQKNETSTQH